MGKKISIQAVKTLNRSAKDSQKKNSAIHKETNKEKISLGNFQRDSKWGKRRGGNNHQLAFVSTLPSPGGQRSSRPAPRRPSSRHPHVPLLHIDSKYKQVEKQI